MNKKIFYSFYHLICLVAFISISQSTCTAPNLYSYSGSCYPQCPWNNTLITYQENNTNTCLTNCSGTTYANDATKTCVATCPQYPILTYYDNAQKRCVFSCSTHPFTFADSSRVCVPYCPSPLFGDQILGVCITNCSISTFYQIYGNHRRCVQICYPNYYADNNRICVEATSCPYFPLTYYGDDSTGLCVLKCPVSRNTFADNSTRKCVLYCPLGTFADSTTQTCVSTCPRIPQYFGSNITRKCLLTCNEGQFADPATHQCTLICTNGRYGDYSSRKCVNICPIASNTFADPLSSLCVSICQANYYADNYTRKCMLAANCQDNTFGDPITQKCVKVKQCSNGLYADRSLRLCVVRCSSWGNPLSGYCQNVCPWVYPIVYYFKDSSTRTCVKTCPLNPRTFGDEFTRNCEPQCSEGYYGNPISTFCVRTCPSNFYANEATNVCVANCTQNSSSILYFHSRNLTCLSDCPINYFANNATLSCVVACTNFTFGYTITRQCLSGCPNGWYGDNSSSTCVRICPSYVGQYADDSTNLCVTTCPSNPDYYGEDIQDGNLKCVANCSISGFFADPLTRKCIYTCDISSGYYGDTSDWRCYSRCPTGYGNPLNSHCVAKCPSYPKIFFGDNQTKTCVLTCPNQTYGDPFINLCVEALGCSNSYVGDDTTNLCVPVCSQFLDLYADPIIGKCVSVCTYPYYADDVTQKCSLTCSANLFKDNSTQRCVSTCPTLPILYGDSISGFCEYNCTVGYGFVFGSRRVCLSVCPSNPPLLADLTNLICVSKCANGTFAFTNNTFRGCLDYCPPQIFNATLNTTLYEDNTTWTCVRQCPYGYYSFAHPTNARIRKCVFDCPMVNSIYYYAQDSKRQCVTICPLLYKFTYADKITFKCSRSCSRNQYKYNLTATCVYSCPSPYFANNVTWNCSSWCQEGWFAQKINNTCVRSCPTNLFGYKKQCISQCPNNTLRYNDNTTWLCVSLCPSYPDYYADNMTVTCVLTCSDGYYADTFTRRCVLPINCTSPTVADPIRKKCVIKCSKDPMYYLNISINTCGLLCQNSTFAYNQTNICVNECPSPYFGVNSTVNFYCVQYCPTGQYMYINGIERRCLNQCPLNLYRDNLTMSCTAICPDYSYANKTNRFCTQSCMPLYADDNSKSCVQKCPTNFSASNNSYKCQSFCDYGEYSFENVCLSACPYPYFADNLTRSCTQKCPHDPLTYANNISRKCSFKCNATQYAFLQNLTCISKCPQGYYRQLNLLLCLSVCPEGYYSDNLTLNCVSTCSASNYSFADPTTKFCVEKCPSDPELFGYNNTCLTQCPLGFFAQNTTRTCVSICPNVSLIYLNESWADGLTRRCLTKCSSLSYAFTNTTHNVCVNMCPQGFYASIQLQSCVERCPSLTYAHNDTNRCIKQCPPGQFADLINNICMPNCSYNSSLYSDSSSASCVQFCPQYPDVYADPTTKSCVLVCPNGYYAYHFNITRKCVTNCVAPYFADSFTSQCVLKCVQIDLSFADSFLRECRSNCSNHTINGTHRQFYQDNSSMSCVQLCPNTPTKFYGQNSTNVCMETCPDNTYGDDDTRICMDKCIFQDPKFTWKDKDNNFCVKICPYGYYADNITRSCERTCSVGYYADFSTRRCVVNCPLNPTSYSVLQAGFGVCVYNCPNGTYSSQISSSCVTICPTSPSLYYIYPPTNACVRQCIYPYYANLQTNICVMSCNVGYYGNLTTKTCQICQSQCVTCSGYLLCTSCITGFYLYQITCVLNCPSYPTLYFAHKQASMCYLNCPSPFFGQTSTGLCQLSCPALKYANLLTRICTSCPTGCILCDSIGCYSCSTLYTFLPSALTCSRNCNATAKYYYLAQCYSQCPRGSFLSYDLLNCLNCSKPCATCFGSSGNCTSCIDSYYYLGQCLKACPTNFYINQQLTCVSCSVNPQRCILQPLTYVVRPFTANFALQAYVIFNRAVNMSLSDFNRLVRIKYNGQALKSNQYRASVYNSTTFLTIFLNTGSLNENSLTFQFPPGSITDQFGNILTTVTVEQPVTVISGVTPQIAQTSVKVTKSTDIISLIFLIIIGLLLIKGGYAVLISLQILQLIHLHIFLYTTHLPYLQYVFLDNLKYFNFMFIPKLFPTLNITNNYYLLFTSDISYLSNSPLIIILSVVLLMYLVVYMLSSKKLIANKYVRKLFKKIRKYRMKYSIVHDAFWITYPYAILISLLQFKFGSFNGTLGIINIFLAIVTFFLYIMFALFVFYLGKKYSKTPQKIPQKYNFIMLEPSSFTLQMPLRYLRKTIFAIALLLPSLQSQAVAILAINIVFFFIYFCYQPSKNHITNYVCISVQILLILLISLFIAYDKVLVKSIDKQYGFSIGMIIVQAIIILILIVWSIYRLILVIKQSQTWQQIYAKLTQNTDPQYIREQQRKRDLQFDFGELDNRSQDEQTQNAIQKVTKKSVIDQKFNIFGQNLHDQQQEFRLEKALKQSRGAKRPVSMESSQKLALKSNSSSGKLFEPNRSANNYRKKKQHLQINQQQVNQTIEQIKLSQKQAEEKSGQQILKPKVTKEHAIWEDIDFDENQL